MTLFKRSHWMTAKLFPVSVISYCKTCISWASNFRYLSRFAKLNTLIFGIAHHHKCNCRDLICNWKIRQIKIQRMFYRERMEKLRCSEKNKCFTVLDLRKSRFSASCSHVTSWAESCSLRMPVDGAARWWMNAMKNGNLVALSCQLAVQWWH